MARYILFCDGSAVKHQPTCDYTVTACSAMSLAGFFSACKNLTPAVFIDFSSCGRHESTCGNQGRVQLLTSRIGLTIGTAYVRQVSCWTTFIVIQ